MPRETFVIQLIFDIENVYALKSVQIRGKDIVRFTNNVLLVKSAQPALPSTQHPWCVSPICIHVS